MMTHPKNIVVDIVGIEIGDRGCSCEEHEICGSVLRNDMAVCLQKVLFFYAHVLIVIALHITITVKIVVRSILFPSCSVSFFALACFTQPFPGAN